LGWGQSWTPIHTRVVVELARGFSRIVGVPPRTRCGDMGRHCGGSRRGTRVRKARLRSWLALDALPQPVSGPPIAECLEPCSEACFDKAGVVGRPGKLRCAQLAASSAD
jgi:hypothetical protein